MPAWRPCAMRRRPSGASSRPVDAGYVCLKKEKQLFGGSHHQGKRCSWSLCGLLYVGSAASDSTLSDPAGLGPASHCARAAANSSGCDAPVTLLLRDASPQEQVKKTAAEEAWRSGWNQEQRKKRYVEAGQAEARKAKKARVADD